MALRLPAANRHDVARRFLRLAVRVVSGQHVFGPHFKTTGESFHEPERIGWSKTVVLSFACDEAEILPHWDPVCAPETTQRPARQRLTWIPFPLPAVEQGSGRDSLPKTLDEIHPTASLQGPEGLKIPLWALGFIDAHVGGLAAHGQAYILRPQLQIHAVR